MRPARRVTPSANPPYASQSIRLELLGNLGNAGLGADLIAGLARPADAYGPDGVVADVDRNTTAQRDHVGELPLCSQIRPVLGLLRPFERWPAERACRIGLAPRQLEVVRGGVVGCNEDAHAAGAVDHRNRDGDICLCAFLDGALRDGEAQFPRDVALHLDLGVRSAGPER